LKEFLKKKFEQLTGSKLYRNSLPSGTCLIHDINRLSHVPIREVWDVGVHQGETVLYFAKYFPKSTIRSFEPVSSNYDLLIQNCRKLENFQAHNLHLGKKIKQLKFFFKVHQLFTHYVKI